MSLSWGAALLVVASTVAIVRPDAVSALYDQLYPSDPGKRRALNECFTQDPNFDRLDAAAREACYRHSIPKPVPGPAARNSNFVDLWRAAGLGRLPQNDIRAEQQARR